MRSTHRQARSKPHGRQVVEWRDVKIYEDWNDPDFLQLRVKRAIGELKKDQIHSRMRTADGWWFWCDGCKCEHLIPWNDVSFIKWALCTGIPRLLAFCLNGEVFIWQPGADRPRGKYNLLTWFELEW
jgi:hypothetical protein